MDKIKKFYLAWIKPFWIFIAGIPTFLAVVELLMFGISLNSGFMRPLVSPSLSCKNESPIQEGKDRLYKTQITFSKPIYLNFLPYSMSIPIRIELSANEGTSFFKANFNKNNFTPLDIEKRFNSNPEVIKNISFTHRFLNKESLIMNTMFSSSQVLLEDECNFSISTFY